MDEARIFKSVYTSSKWSELNVPRLNQTFGQSTVYAIVIHNITMPIAMALHKNMVRTKAYLGAMVLDFSYGPHLVYFRSYIGTQYRIMGRECRIFYTMSDEENSCFETELDEVRQYGFNDVGWEDRGAHGTVFDDYDTPEHFSQLAVFKRTIAQLVPDGDDGASDFAFILEDLSPRLFWTLAAAFERLPNGDNEEAIAQAALSGRRFLEQLADALFPASTELHRGRPVGQPQYKNRLWAFIALHAPTDLAKRLGKEVDRLDNEFNGGLHGSRQGPRLVEAFAALTVLTGTILQLNPDAARNPYHAHSRRMLEVFKDIATDVVERHDKALT
ncbi:hypothetical protein LZK73_01895 [Neorhizobium galegae]|nr:hypothetical protein LZK73_01895 [Neorhizobium galegae]